MVPALGSDATRLQGSKFHLVELLCRNRIASRQWATGITVMKAT